MAIEDVRNELEAVKVGANDFVGEVAAIAAEDRYRTIPARAQQVAALATEMATLIGGIYTDADGFDNRIRGIWDAARERLRDAAAHALEGSTNISGKSSIMLSFSYFGCGMYLPDSIVQAGDSIELPIGPDEAKKIADRANGWADDLQQAQQDIEEITPKTAAGLANAIDAYIQNL